MPGYNLPPPPPPGLNGMTTPYQPGFQYELQMRDQHITRLQMDNMRLQVKLELAQTDLKIAMQMMMAAHRFRFDEQDVISPVKALLTPKIERGAPDFSEPKKSPVYDHTGWPSHDGCVEVVEGSSGKHGRAAGELGGAWDDSLKGGWTDSGRKARGSRDDLKGRANGDWGCPQESMQPVPEPLIDLNPDGPCEQERVRALQTNATPLGNWGSTAVLRSPFVTPVKGQRGGSWLPASKDESMSISTPCKVVKPDKSRFKQLFPFEEDEDTGPVPFPNYDEGAAQHTKKANDILEQVSNELAVQAAGHSKIPIITSENKMAELSGSAMNGGGKLTSSDELGESSGNMHTRQVSDSSDPNLSRVPRGPRRRQGDRHGPGRFNGRRGVHSDEEEPSTLPPRDDVAYKPSENEKNTRRSVIIYNLPPQTDVAQIVSRARDSPFLWIKLLLTQGMKGKKQDGSTGVLDTITALMTFFLESSAEQFVFDLEQEPLVVRGRVAIAKLLDTPTFPSQQGINTYEGALGRHKSRRIKFQQCSLVTAQEFDEVLEGQDHGYRAPGWIVDKTMKKEDGKNMITVEFASLETARWAYYRLRTDPSFAGCWPTWVFDHGGEAEGSGKHLLKTRDDEDSTDGEISGNPAPVVVPKLKTDGQGEWNVAEKGQAEW